MHIIAGLHKNRSIISPKGKLTRPTSSKLRAALFNICQFYIEGTHFLDLFAGSGAMGLEALSRGALKVVFVDNHRQCVLSIQENLRNFKEEERGLAICSDAFGFLEKTSMKFGIIYADPPYEALHSSGKESISYSEKILNLVDEKKLLQPNGLLFLEDSNPIEIKERGSLRLKSVRSFGHSTLLEYQNQQNE